MSTADYIPIGILMAAWIGVFVFTLVWVGRK